MLCDKFTLLELLDLALRVPEVGAVNFNILHTVLTRLVIELQLDHIRPMCYIHDEVAAQAAITKGKIEDPNIRGRVGLRPTKDIEDIKGMIKSADLKNIGLDTFLTPLVEDITKKVITEELSHEVEELGERKSGLKKEEISEKEEGTSEEKLEKGSPSTSKEIIPSASKEAIPSASKEASPSASKEASPSPSKEASSSPPKEASPSSSKEASPLPSKEASPSPSKEEISLPSKEESPSLSKEESPLPSKEESPSPSKEESPSPSKEESPSPSKEESPSVSKEASPSASKEASASPSEEKETEDLTISIPELTKDKSLEEVTEEEKAAEVRAVATEILEKTSDKTEAAKELLEGSPEKETGKIVTGALKALTNEDIFSLEPAKVIQEMWRVININRRMDGAEEGMRELSSIVDMMLDKISEMEMIINKMENILERVTQLESLCEEFESRIDDAVTIFSVYYS
ncbi:uncharacterized protein TNCT_527071 [Trichonephila clavata]|uniref:Uncharacterized protein n=1 Tax=Trichonephila clavata TaxID=2740835 RepID=A0A8X6GX02_TRICU|nr:uncharacterized protein TNCT_527071 [Trichonephila clavata]